MVWRGRRLERPFSGRSLSPENRGSAARREKALLDDVESSTGETGADRAEPLTPLDDDGAEPSDRDPAGGDSGQSGSERDRRPAGVDRGASVSDPARSRPIAASADGSAHGGVDREDEHESTAASRSRTTAMRFAAAARRDELALIRDRAAAARDDSAGARDTRAAAGDSAVEARTSGAAPLIDLAEVIAALGALRVAGASNREQSALERISAANDRDASGEDRHEASDDRRFSGLDELTGVFRRGTGELALSREIDRARRSGTSLVVAIIDIDELKAVNDNQGHAAGDALLRDVPTAISSTLRSYDVTVRWGGDEFVYALSGVSLEEASSRAAEIQLALETRRPGASMSTGLAELEDDDTLESLIARADAALRRVKVARKR